MNIETELIYLLSVYKRIRCRSVARRDCVITNCTAVPQSNSWVLLTLVMVRKYVKCGIEEHENDKSLRRHTRIYNRHAGAGRYP